MLVHICCSVDSHFFLQKLKDLYPNEELIGFFYDPNIHPFSEYQLRLMDVRRSCKNLGVHLIEGNYDFDGWCEAVRGLEDEPEKGKRCSVCFDTRLEETAKKAIELDQKDITTTLFTSPKKSIEQLKNSAKQIEKDYGIKVATPDFRKRGGTAEQFALAKKDMLYHQNYCGCIYALEVQRENQKRLKDELMEPIDQQILPASIQDRLNLYSQVIRLEEDAIRFRLLRQRFLNYRLLFAKVLDAKKNTVPSYFLAYSSISKNKIKGRIEFIEKGLGYFNKENIRFIGLQTFNKLTQNNFHSVQELMFQGLEFEKQLLLRSTLNSDLLQDLSPIIVVDTLSEDTYEIHLCSHVYEDVRENLVKIG